MNYQVLAVELAAGHPDTGAYDADDAIAAVKMNVVNRTAPKATMTASEVYNAIDAGEFAGLDTDALRQEVWNILHLGTLNPHGAEKDRMVAIFGAGSATISALSAARVNIVSRAAELGLGVVREGTITQARAM